MDYSRLALPKPESRSKIKRRRRAHQSAVIRETREFVWDRDRGCRYTGVPRDDDEMHEIVPRSKTRGMPPEERFNTGNCIRLSREIHRKVTRHQLEIEVTDAGADGTVVFCEGASRRISPVSRSRR